MATFTKQTFPGNLLLLACIAKIGDTLIGFSYDELDYLEEQLEYLVPGRFLTISSDFDRKPIGYVLGQDS
jgi:hypothetical protein